MEKKWYSLEEKIVAVELSLYMKENHVTLEQAYKDKLVPKDMQLTEEQINEITSKYHP